MFGGQPNENAPWPVATLRSSAKSAALVASPPPKPVSLPVAPITRWQGTTMGSGLLPFAAPTARDAVGLPMVPAISP